MICSPSIQYLFSKFKVEEAQRIRNIMLKSEYRNAETQYEKVCVLIKPENHLTIANACKAVGISTKTYYRYKNLAEEDDNDMEKNAPNQLLTNLEENEIIDQIEKAQLNSNCFSGQDVRELAQEIYHRRTDENRIFSRGWFRLFLDRHSDSIGKKKCASADDDRGTISLEKINQYIKEIFEVLPLIKDLRLLINMDESGFGRRPDYKKRRSCVYSKKLKIEPLWRAATDNYHVSWICGITAAATALRHMFITTRKNMDPDFDQTFLRNFGDFAWAPKGYMIEKNMIQWIQDILIPHVINVRTEINQENHPVILILDNLAQHLTDAVMHELDKIKPIYIIQLPPHSSHITQPCDGCAFGAVKYRYTQLPFPNFKSQFTSKLCRIKNAIQQSLTQEVILASWNKCGFNISISNGECSDISFSESFQEELRMMGHQENE